ncbi:MAG: aquaporin [Ruminococcus sp.]|jgi:aquaporin Z|nr:aquaporin [Ruminococcus sp.]
MNPSTIRKFVAEFFGTFTLVFLGCGTAMRLGCASAGGYIATALAFGLVIVGMAYCVGNVSGCHINPAVSLAVFLNGGMTSSEFAGYVVSQCAGSFFGTVMLRVIFGVADINDMTAAKDKDWGMGANTLAGVDGSIIAGLLVEIILTFIFVLVILGVTSKKAKHGSFGGLVIGFTLVLIHIFGIGMTGTSVNPARSLWPAVFSLGDAIKQLWVFIVGPFVGAFIAAILHKFLEADLPEAENK